MLVSINQYICWAATIALLEIERNARSRWHNHRESHPFQESSGFFPASQSIRPSLKPPKWFKTISRPDYSRYTQFATGHGYTSEYYSRFVPKNPTHCNCDLSDVPIVQTLGAKGHLSRGDIEVTLRFFKQFIHTLSRGYMVETFAMYPPL